MNYIKNGRTKSAGNIQAVFFLMTVARTAKSLVGGKNMLSDYLFSNPSFIDGVMSIVDLFGVSQEYNYSSTEDSADSRAMFSDANAVKIDLAEAYKSMMTSYA
ncbi:hypothetical protein [uncultured Treponema sp.]|uniref:hypothetical protein n=2 Tax=uncultured Treponema sp. TaxID=162155 RepID=UPI0025891371|nr:hypothetical protein [uncultured Treponema sp.]